MVALIVGIANSAWSLLLEMSPYLLLGFFVAGLLKTDKLVKVGGKFETNTVIKNIQSAGFIIEEKGRIK